MEATLLMQGIILSFYLVIVFKILYNFSLQRSELSRHTKDLEKQDIQS